MDFKITNYDVSTEQIYLEQTAELPIDADFMLSDFEGDIKKVLNCEVKPYVTSKLINGNSFIIEGGAVVKVIYSNREGEIFSTEQEIPFKKNFEAIKPLDGGYGEVYASALIHSCRAVTERKISIRSSVKLDGIVKVIEKREIISDIDSSSFEQLKGEAFATMPLGMTQKSIVIDEEIVLPQNLPSAKRIIRTSAVSDITDCKIIADKTIIKGNLKISILYCNESDELTKYKVNLPFNQIVDIIGLNEFCDCDVYSNLCGLDVSMRNSDEDECRKFMLISKLEISVSARCSGEIPVIYDLYSTKYNVTPNSNEVKFSKLIKQFYEEFICKKILSLPNGDVVKILDIWCNSGSTNMKYENKSAVLCGNISACVIYESSDGMPDFFERIIDFEYPINFEEDIISPYCHPKVKVSNCEFSITPSGEPEVKLELIIQANIYDTYAYSVITELDVDENTPTKNKSSLIAYYADRGEKVWEIAKQFCAKRSEFLKINHLTEDTVQSAKMLLIPLM